VWNDCRRHRGLPCGPPATVPDSGVLGGGSGAVGDGEWRGIAQPGVCMAHAVDVPQTNGATAVAETMRTMVPMPSATAEAWQPLTGGELCCERTLAREETSFSIHPCDSYGGACLCQCSGWDDSADTCQCADMQWPTEAFGTETLCSPLDGNCADDGALDRMFDGLFDRSSCTAYLPPALSPHSDDATQSSASIAAISPPPWDGYSTPQSVAATVMLPLPSDVSNEYSPQPLPCCSGDAARLWAADIKTVPLWAVDSRWMQKDAMPFRTDHSGNANRHSGNASHSYSASHSGHAGHSCNASQHAGLISQHPTLVQEPGSMFCDELSTMMDVQYTGTTGPGLSSWYTGSHAAGNADLSRGSYSPECHIPGTESCVQST